MSETLATTSGVAEQHATQMQHHEKEKGLDTPKITLGQKPVNDLKNRIRVGVRSLWLWRR